MNRARLLIVCLVLPLATAPCVCLADDIVRLHCPSLDNTHWFETVTINRTKHTVQENAPTYTSATVNASFSEATISWVARRGGPLRVLDRDTLLLYSDGTAFAQCAVQQNRI